jgi:hypothetical protein
MRYLVSEEIPGAIVEVVLGHHGVLSIASGLKEWDSHTWVKKGNIYIYDTILEVFRGFDHLHKMFIDSIYKKFDIKKVYR